MKILLVDKDEAVHKFVNTVLSRISGKASHCMLNVTTPKGALDLYTEHNDSIDLILMGTCSSGSVITLDLTKKIRETYKGEMIAVSSQVDLAEKLCEAGCDQSIHSKLDIARVIKAREP